VIVGRLWRCWLFDRSRPQTCLASITFHVFLAAIRISNLGQNRQLPTSHPSSRRSCLPSIFHSCASQRKVSPQYRITTEGTSNRQPQPLPADRYRSNSQERSPTFPKFTFLSSARTKRGSWSGGDASLYVSTSALPLAWHTLRVTTLPGAGLRLKIGGSKS
jgi:hypothetical protein